MHIFPSLSGSSIFSNVNLIFLSFLKRVEGSGRMREEARPLPACLEGAPHVYPSMRTGRMDGFKRMDSLFGELAARLYIVRDGTLRNGRGLL